MLLLKSSRALLAVLLCGVAGAALAQGADAAASVAKGKRLYMRCAACHDVSDTGPARVGPHLKGLVGRPAGAVAGYGYSADMKSRSFVWDEAALDAWLTKPSTLVPATSMAFAGMPDAAERKALIAFLRSLK
jgi:cytochrome c